MFDIIANNLLAAPILFFLIGFMAIVMKSDLELPPALSKLLSLYLIMSIGLKGGVELNHGGISLDSIKALGVGLTMAAVVPFVCYWILRQRLNVYDSAAIAATYGSVSAVTFVTGVAVLDVMHIPYHGYMVAALALMEAPAIIIGVAMVRSNEEEGKAHFDWGTMIRETLLHGPIFILLGSLVVGQLMSHTSAKKVMPFFEGLFPGVLCLYLFEMGVNASRRLTALNSFNKYLLVFAILVPLFNAAIAIFASYALGLDKGDALLLVVLCASASYVAVPAAMQVAVPKADPGLYLTMALGITFPFNIAVGIPLYLTALDSLLG